MTQTTTTEAIRRTAPPNAPSRTQPVCIGKSVFRRLHNDAEFIDRWRRMHRGRRPLVAVRLRFVTWAVEEQPTQRFVWELCRWPKGASFEWMFVCWLLDEVGMWWKAFPSKRAALEYSRQAPEVVMARKSSGPGDEVEKRAS